MLQPLDSHYCFSCCRDILSADRDVHIRLGHDVQDMTNETYQVYEEDAEANGNWKGW